MLLQVLVMSMYNTNISSRFDIHKFINFFNIFRLWIQMCDAYARQLEDAGEVTKASTYLVAIKKFKEAALMLLKHKLFREALAITKSQEPQDNETILEITKKWAEYNVTHGHPKEAAHWLKI